MHCPLSLRHHLELLRLDVGVDGGEVVAWVVVAVVDAHVLLQELVHCRLSLELGVVQVGREHDDGVAEHLHICLYHMPSSIGLGICVVHAWHLRGVRRVYAP